MKYDPVDSTTGTPESRTWRPWPLRWPFLVGFIVLCLVLCIGIELVLLGCATGGCRVFGKTSNELSNVTYFTYNQLPTVLSLILNLLWAIPHHDVMRLEPYFRMSAPGGESAEDSIFLNYPYTFALFVPFVAGKRGHYQVMLSSCIALSMGFLVTPLIAGIFDDALLPRLVPDTDIRGALRPVTPNSTLSGAFTYTAYHAEWLNGSFPAFTTPEYAVLPVGLDYTGETFGGETWTAQTTLYEAELTCERAGSIVITSSNDTGISANITSRDGAYHVNLCDQREKNFALLQYIADVNAAHAAQVRALASAQASAQVFRGNRASQVIQTGQNFAAFQGAAPLTRSLSTRSDEPNLQCHGFTTFITPWTAIAQRVLYAPTAVNGSDVYLYGWASGASPSWPSTDSAPHPTNITALFCTTRYYSQAVTAIFGMPDGNVIGVNRTGVREPFIDLLNFDEIINGETGALATPPEAKNSDGAIFGLGYRPAQAPNADSQLQRWLGVRPANVSSLFVVIEENEIDTSSHSSVYIDNVNGLPGLALSDLSPDNFGELLDPMKLAEVYQSALRTMFALAVTGEMVYVDSRNSSNFVPVMRSIWVKGFRVNTLWARGSQGGLLVVVMMAILLTVMTGRRPCNLDGEPNSLAEALRLLAASPEVSAEMENAEFHDPKDLVEVFKEGGGYYVLDLVPGQGPRVLRTTAVRKHSRLQAPGKGKQEPWMEQLWQLRVISGMAFMTFFGVVGVLLAVAFAYSRSTDGLPTLSRVNSVQYKVLFSYIPIAVGMASEPILISIASCQCMLAPYTMLTRGPASSSKALAVDFDKSPPHFQLLRSLRTRNIILAALTVAILLCNVLAVALAGLFTGTVRRLESTTEVISYPAAQIRAGFTLPAQEMYFLLAEQLSGHDVLPFTTPEYYVLPVQPIGRDRVERYEASTMGIGVDVKCDLVPAKNISLGCENPGCVAAPPTELDQLSDFFVLVDNACWGHNVSSATMNAQTFTTNYTWKGLSHDNIFQSSECPNNFFPLWVERPWNPDPKDAGDLYEDRLNSLIMACRAVEKVVELNVVVTADQQVLSASPVRVLDPDQLAALYVGNTTNRLAQTFIDIIHAGIRTENSPDSHKIRWLNYLMKTIEPKIVRNATNMTHIPDEAYIVGAFEDVYRRLFAINLLLSEKTVLALGQPKIVSVSATLIITRVDVSGLMFCIAAVIILVIMVVLVFLYCRRKQPVGYLPQHLAGMYALLYASNAKEECGQLYGRDPAERAKNLDEVGGLYVCGRFPDGEHYGVHRTSAGPDTTATEKERKSFEKER